ncbi:diguanylate cyclase [Salipiger aestuarii]|uniref:diguanylate cyclase n=1 Tax=Salipiger aestuarii TaxID=568098 RepID=A0A327YFP5_9RHOB|nr:GGDEF domain-containing protein [Salipiger aestuarii]EIE52701.1 diguanylate cyclase, putative [Citreicella sp. 357]KAA8607421.1 diguanylate cyclase [Salipiger aestuarii]KAA8612093.1 diguanylate cyclase [Salipiger aestuarii]KAB2541726.1 diguanylate cyclase [Salipiger aestuarii]RAK17279.1 diguanylate cyclase (GGDEF)-like protein [Salipiger aestuarii]
MSLPFDTLDALMPMHLQISRDGRLRHAGPTLRKLLNSSVGEGRHFADVIEVYRPKRAETLPMLLELAGRRLQTRLRCGRRVALKGLVMPDGAGGAIVNLSFGIGVVDGVRMHSLTSTDFAVTDLAIDMLYLVEAKSAAMEASRTLNRRLQGAMMVAEQRAFTDALTGLQNRRAMDEALKRLIRGGERFAVLHLDLDFFKQVNDTRGHAAGDRVLQAVARVMIDLTRKNDFVARVGGDEFVIILDGLTDRGRLAELADRLIERIEHPIPVDGDICRISASIGIAFNRPDAMPMETGAQLLERADEALYSAKRHGRAQHAFSDEDVVRELP